MAGVQATIDLVVKGSGAVNRLIEDVNQLESAVRKINSKTLDVASKTLSSKAGDISEQISKIGTANDPRQKIAKQFAKLARDQEKASNSLIIAELNREKAIKAAARAEEQLMKKSKLRTKSGIEAQKKIEDTLNSSRVAASAATEKARQLVDVLATIGRKTNILRQKTSAELTIPKTRDLINVNQVIATQRAIRLLAEEYNKLGDSAQPGAEERRLSRTDLPAKIQEFTALANQIDVGRAKVQELREELLKLKGQKTLPTPGIPKVETLESLMEVENIRERNDAIKAQNAEFSRRRKIIGSQLREENNLIKGLEQQAIQAGNQTLKLQERLANLGEFRYRDEPVTGLNISLNQIQAQAEALALVANNSSIAEKAFQQFTVAAEVASVKLGRAQQSTFAALAAGFSSSPDENIAEIQGRPMAGAKNVVKQLISDIPNLTRSEAALNTHIQLLTKIRTILPFMSLEYRQVEEAIAELVNELEGVGLKGQFSKIDPGAGERARKKKEREDKAEQRRAFMIKKITQDQLDITSKIESSRLSIAEKKSLNLGLQEATGVLGRGQVENASLMTNELAKQFRKYEDNAKAKNKELQEAKDISSKIAQHERTLANIQKAYNLEERKGVKFLEEKTQLTELLNRLSQKGVALTAANAKVLGQNVKYFRDMLDARVLDTKLQGAYQIPKKDPTAEQLEDRRTNLLKKALSIQKTIDSAEVAGIQVAKEKQKIESSILRLKKLQGQANEEELKTLLRNIQYTGLDVQEAFNKKNKKKPRVQVFGELGTEFVPITGKLRGVNIPGSPAEKEAKKEQIQKLAQYERTLINIEKAYNFEQSKGVKFLEEKVKLTELLKKFSQKEVTPVTDSLSTIGEQIKYFNDTLTTRVLEAKIAGAYQIPEKDPTAEQLEDRRARLLDRALGIQKIVTGVEVAGVQVAKEKQEIESSILRLKELQGQASKEELRTLLKRVQTVKIDIQDAFNIFEKNKLLYTGRPEIDPSASLSQIQAQAELLARKAGSASVSGNAFREFTVGAEVASIQLGRAQQKAFAALAAGFSGQAGTSTGFGVGMNDAKAMVSQLIADIPKLTKSEAALGTHIQLLTKIRTVLPFLSSEYKAVEQAIKGLVDELEEAKSGGKVTEASPDTNQRKAEQAQRRQDAADRRQAANDKLLRKQAGLEKLITDSVLSQLQKETYLTRLAEAQNQLAENRLYLARESTEAVQEQVQAAIKLNGLVRSPVQNKLAKELVYEQQVTSVKEGQARAIQAATKLQQILVNLKERGVSVDTISNNLNNIIANHEERKARAIQLGVDLESKEVKLLLQQVTAQQRLAQLAKKKYGVETEIDRLTQFTKKKYELGTENDQVDQAVKETRLSDVERTEIKAKLEIARNALKVEDLDYARQLTKEVEQQVTSKKKFQKAVITTGQAQRNQLEVLKDISNRYKILESKGVSFGSEKSRLEALIRNLESGLPLKGTKVPTTAEVETAVDNMIKRFRQFEGSRRNEAILAGTFVTRTNKEDPATIQIKQTSTLLDLQKRYRTEKQKGVELNAQELSLNEKIKSLIEGKIAATTKNIANTGTDIKVFRNELEKAVLEAKVAGTYQKSVSKPETVETRLGRVSGLAYGALEEIVALEKKGIEIADGRLVVEQAIADIQKIQAKVKKGNTENAMDELEVLREQLGFVRQTNKELKSKLGAGLIGGAGLRASLKSINESRTAAAEFLGKASPEQAIDQIVRSFNNSGITEADEALLELKQLKAPSKATTAELMALSEALEALRLNISPLTPNAKKLDRELSNASARIQRNLESRDPNADPLVKLTRDPRTANAISEGLIGGVFPLLFGQGIGASIGGLFGGGAGGFLGGGLGFGLSLAGTALGSMFDQLNQAAQETGKSLNYPIEGFEKLKEANLFSSRAQEYYISKLIETGQTARATAEIQAEMIRKIGVSGVNDLMELGNASSQLSKAWAEFNLQLQAALAGPMAGLLKWITEIISINNQQNRSLRYVQEIESGLTGADLEQFKAEKDEIRGLSRRSILFGGITLEEVLKRQRALADRFSARSLQQARTPKEDFEAQQQAIQAQRQAADEIKSAYREGFQLQQQIIDLERKQIDIRRRVENEIFTRQQEVLRLQIDNERKATQIAIDRVDIEYQRRISNEEGRVAQVLAAEAELVKVRAEGEANIAASKKMLELDIAKQKRETQNYIYNLEREAESIRRETLSLEMQILDYREQIERKIQDRRLTAIAQERAALQEAAGGTPGPAGAPARTGPTGNPTGSGGAGAYGATSSGLITGPSRLIGGSADYHQDLSFGPNVSVESQIGMLKSLAEAYARLGKVIELSNNTVSGMIFPLRGTLAQQEDWLMKGLRAHQSRNGGTGRRALDFYARSVTGTRWGASVVDQPMLMPLIPGASYEYGTGARSGRFVKGRVRGQEQFTLMHGRTDGPSPRNFTASGTSPSTSSAGGETRQLEEARRQVEGRLERPIGPPAGAGAAMVELDTREERLRRAAIQLAEQEADINEERARQRLYEAARGPIEIQQAREKLSLAKAEFEIRASMSDIERELASIDISQQQAILNRQQIDSEILAKTRKENRGVIERAQLQALEALQERNKLEKEATRIAIANRVLTESGQQTMELLKEIEARKLRNRLLAEGVAPEIIEGELRVLAVQQKTASIIRSYDIDLAALLKRTYDGTEATYESAKAKLAELSATTGLTEEQKKLKKELEDILRYRGLIPVTLDCVLV